MKDKTAHVVSSNNCQTLSFLSGIPLKTMQANPGWVALYNESRIPFWSLVPRRFFDNHRSDEYELVET